MTDNPPFECGPECPAPDHHGRGPRAQGHTTSTAHVEIANDGPGQIYVGDPAQPASPGMMRQAEAQADAPVYGPAAPTEAAAGPDGSRVLSRVGVADHVTGFGWREHSYGGFGGRTSILPPVGNDHGRANY